MMASVERGREMAEWGMLKKRLGVKLPEQVAEWRRRLEEGDIPLRQRKKMAEEIHEEKKRPAEHAR